MEQIENYTPHIDEIMQMIGDRAERSEVEKELRTRIERNRLDIDSAKRGIVRKFGGAEDYVPGETEITKISDIEDGQKRYNVIGIIENINIYDQLVQNENKKITDGVITDSSGSVKFRIWSEINLELNKCYKFKNCKYSEKFNNLVCEYNNIKPTENEIKINPLEVQLKNTIQLCDLSIEFKGKSIKGIIENISERIVNKKEGPTPVNDIILCEDGYRIKITDWDRRPLQIGDFILITNISISNFNNRLYFSIGSYSKVTVVKGD